MASEQSNRDILGSFVLIGATVAALVVANSGLAGAYKGVLGTVLPLGPADLGLAVPLKDWIKNALMAVFFLYVGLEIKAEFKEGALADRRRAILPIAGATGGMAMPALVYLAVTGANPETIRGWAIPAATDIAFAVGVVGLLGKRVPPALKAFLLALAVIDDLGAILIIALFYTGGVAMVPLAIAGGICLALFALNWRGVAAFWPYLLLGLGLWFFVLQSGVNPTLAGVILALFIPLKADGGSPLHRLFDVLKPWILFLIMPVFAFANAGVSMAGLGLADLMKPITAGVALGLVVGKPIGILLVCFLAIRSGLAVMPAGVTWVHMAGAGAIAGIGFTMSLFIGALAFGDGALMDQVRLGVLSGSLVATLLGVALMMTARPQRVLAGEKRA